jgi:HlyD family secretion protein
MLMSNIVKIKVGDEANVEVDAYLKAIQELLQVSQILPFSINFCQVTNFKVKVRILKESYEDLLEG